MAGQPVVLDLFCCQGGAAMGYHQAGFRVVGVDKDPQPRYPFEFHQADALEFLADHGREFDLLHGSPPCHDNSPLRHLSGLDGTGWLLDAARRAFRASGKPFVLENTMDADMQPTFVLCGSMFNLRASDRVLRRHRQFETSFFGLQPADMCAGRLVGGVYGTGGGGQMTRGYKFRPDEARAAMGIDWMDRAGLSQAIPPAYTRFIGEQLRAHLDAERAA